MTVYFGFIIQKLNYYSLLYSNYFSDTCRWNKKLLWIIFIVISNDNFGDRDGHGGTHFYFNNDAGKAMRETTVNK